MKRQVVLIPGYGDITGGRANFARLEPALRRAGFMTHNISLPYGGMHSMEKNVASLAEGITRIQVETGEEKLHLIGHSLGGLTAIAYEKLYPAIAALSTDKVIALGAPLRGTRSATRLSWIIPFSRAAQQMKFESEYVMSLRKLPLPVGPDVHTIAARHDTMYVTPWDSSLFLLGATKHLIAPWKKEVVIDDEPINIIHCHVGHLSMVLKKPVIDAVIHILNSQHPHTIPPD